MQPPIAQRRGHVEEQRAMSEGRSPAYERFLESLRGGRDWNDALDLDAFREARPEERTELRRLLIERFHQSGDSRIPLALAATGSLDTDAPLLLAALREQPGRARVRAGQALLELVQTELVHNLTQLAANPKEEVSARQMALDVLDQIRGANVTSFFVDMLEALEPVVRRACIEKLAERIGLAERMTEPLSGAWLLLRRARSRFESISAPARAEMRAVATTNPPSSYPFEPPPPTHEWSTFLVSLSVPSDEIDLPALKRLTGERRLAAITALAEHVAQGDARAVRAFGMLGDPAHLDVVRSALDGTVAMVIEAAAALSRLAQDRSELPKVLEVLNSPGHPERIRAAKALAAFRDVRASHALDRACRDPDPAVADAARRSLETLRSGAALTFLNPTALSKR
jgi:hypothetical protein